MRSYQKSLSTNPVLYRYVDLPKQRKRQIKTGINCFISEDSDFRLSCRKNETPLRVFIGDNCHIGSRVSFRPNDDTQHGAIHIGDNCSINSDCILIGDIQTGANSLLGPQIYLSSGNHQATHKPHWLIRDQDKYPRETSDTTDSVSIAEDCWLGKSVFVRAGVSIGRGAIIGANAIVTKDVPPYCIMAGVPGKIIGHRLEFIPPNELHASEESNLPYFYSGFEHRRSRQSKDGMPVVGKFSFVLGQTPFKKIKISGKASREMKCDVFLNGLLLGKTKFAAGNFETSMTCRWSSQDIRKAGACNNPSFLAQQNLFSVEFANDKLTPLHLSRIMYFA